MPLALAVDIGGSSVKLGLVDEAGLIHAEEWVETPKAGEPETLIERITAAADSLRRNRSGHPPIGVGVSVAGFLDESRETMIYNANLPALAGFPLRHRLSERLELPAFLDVDSNAAALAEYRFGDFRASSRFLCIVIGTGLGGSVMIDGELLRYCGQCSGDLGHIVVDPDGERCSCGGRGCLETRVSAPRLALAMKRPASDAIAAALSGDEGCQAALAEMGGWLGLGLSSLVSIYAVDRIVIGGGVSAAGDLLIRPTQEAFAARAPIHFKRNVEIAVARLAPKAGLVGAACVAFEGVSKVA